MDLMSLQIHEMRKYIDDACKYVSCISKFCGSIDNFFMSYFTKSIELAYPAIISYKAY